MEHPAKTSPAGQDCRQNEFFDIFSTGLNTTILREVTVCELRLP
jgi:hypothetical protein